MISQKTYAFDFPGKCGHPSGGAPQELVPAPDLSDGLSALLLYSLFLRRIVCSQPPQLRCVRQPRGRGGVLAQWHAPPAPAAQDVPVRQVRGTQVRQEPALQTTRSVYYYFFFYFLSLLASSLDISLPQGSPVLLIIDFLCITHKTLWKISLHGFVIYVTDASEFTLSCSKLPPIKDVTR